MFYYCNKNIVHISKTYVVCFHIQHQEQVITDTVDGREIYNTIRRKTKDAFYKNIVKKGYLLFNKGVFKRKPHVNAVSAQSAVTFFHPCHRQAKASGGRIFTSSWRETTPSLSTSRVRKEPPNPKG